MKVRWWIEGAGCPFQQCGLSKGVILDIDEADLPDGPEAREKYIYDIVQNEFDNRVYPQWEAADHTD